MVYVPRAPSYELSDELDNTHVMIAVLSLVGGNRTHVTIPKDILTTTALYHSAIEVLIRTHLNQLPLLLRRTQATTYIPSHLYLSYDHTYTPYDERYCPSCLPIKIVGNELHTLLLCPHSSPISHPATLGLTCALRRYDLCSWSSHTPLHQTGLLLGSTPPEILRKFDQAWTHSTSTICTQLLYSVQSRFLKHQPPASPGPVSPLPCLSVP